MNNKAFVGYEELRDILSLIPQLLIKKLFQYSAIH